MHTGNTIQTSLFSFRHALGFSDIILPCNKKAQITHQKYCQWKNRIATLLVVLADKAKLPLYIILKRKTIPKRKLPEGAIFRCQDKGWTSELMQDLLHVACNRQPGALLKQTGMLAPECISRVRIWRNLKNLRKQILVLRVFWKGTAMCSWWCCELSFRSCMKKLYRDWILGRKIHWKTSINPKGVNQETTIGLPGTRASREESLVSVLWRNYVST